MIFKIAVNSVIRGASSWLALIVASIALSVVVALSLGMIVAGASASGEAQQAFVSMGATALGFTVLTALASFRLVVGTCVRLQRQDVALWQIAGILPGTAHLVVATEIVLVTAVSAALGAALSLAMWPPYLHFVDGSGLPETDVLHRPLPIIAIAIAVGTTTLTSLLCGLRSARKIVRADLVTGVHPASTPPQRSTGARIVTAIVAVLLIAGTVTLYLVIAHAHVVTDPDDMAGVLSSYAGMGLLICLVFAILSGPIIRGLVRLIKTLPFAGTAGFLASREANARPQLTQALVVPITLAAAAVGIMAAWINELTTVMAAQAGSEEKVNAPPRQMALLLGGPVIVACVRLGHRVRHRIPSPCGQCTAAGLGGHTGSHSCQGPRRGGDPRRHLPRLRLWDRRRQRCVHGQGAVDRPCSFSTDPRAGVAGCRSRRRGDRTHPPPIACRDGRRYAQESRHHHHRRSPMTSWIHATGVHKGFGRGARRVEVLRGVDLDVEPGEFVTVVGSSGAGKSTLLYCLCGLIPADDGQISLVGNDIRTASRSQLARIRRDHVGFIFQDLNLISSLTVRDNVVLPARMAGRRPRRRDVNQVLDAVGLASQASKYPAHLSGGQRQRVAIARSLLHQPELLLADEPTGSLDVSSRDTVLELLRATVSETTSLVMVTHDLDIAATADRVVVLADGHNDRILTRPSSAEVFQALHTGPRHSHADYTGAS